ncbi:MAG: hypothetical protein ISR87_12055 [Candidatus Marinimicrobia bacterium]|nr:hypothetical protein [FCB group bacterium]MBL7026180.1 hypothetical protein [Candidatus Neomarinimicrobiota bacterium]
MKKIQRPAFWIQMLIIGSFLLSISACETADPVLLEEDIVDTGLTEAKIQEAADRAEQAEYRLVEIRSELASVQQTLDQRDADLQVITQRLIRTQRLVTVLILILIGLSYSLWRVRFGKRPMVCPDWRAVLTQWGLLRTAKQVKTPQKDPEPKKPVAKKPVAKKPVAKKPVAKKPATKKPATKKPTDKK